MVFILQSFTTASFSLFFKTLQVKDFQSKNPSPTPRIVRKICLSMGLVKEVKKKNTNVV